MFGSVLAAAFGRNPLPEENKRKGLFARSRVGVLGRLTLRLDHDEPTTRADGRTVTVFCFGLIIHQYRLNGGCLLPQTSLMASCFLLQISDRYCSSPKIGLP